MLHKLLFFLVLSLSLWADRSGPYLGIGYGAGFYEPGSRVAEVSNEPYNVRFTAGAYINENLSVELNIAEFGGAQLGYNLSSYRSQNSTSLSIEEESFRVFSVSTLAHYPFYNDTFDVFGRFGAGTIGLRTTAPIDDTNTDSPVLVFGGGASWRVTPMLSVIAGYDHYTFQMLSADATLGSAYISFEVQF